VDDVVSGRITPTCAPPPPPPPPDDEDDEVVAGELFPPPPPPALLDDELPPLELHALRAKDAAMPTAAMVTEVLRIHSAFRQKGRPTLAGHGPDCSGGELIRPAVPLPEPVTQSLRERNHPATLL
jgi:hypothetical protein